MALNLNYTPGKIYIDPKIQNVLDHYRSYTYNFTLSAVSREDCNDPKKFQSDSVGHVILKSGGKGTTGLKPPQGATTAQVQANADLQESATTDMGDAGKIAEASQKNIDTLQFNADLVPGFNKNSPGRFDMFIDKFEIHTTFDNSLSGFGTIQLINFTVIEPYSINGFFEALHTAAVAVGYTMYAAASFKLTLKFLGYPDDKEDSVPEEVPYATRHWLIGFKNVGMEVTEKGTVYTCSTYDKGTGAAADSNNTLRKSISYEGITVQEALAGPVGSDRPNNYSGKDFVTQLNKLQKDNTKDRNGSDVYDEYRIFFPEIVDGMPDYTKVNKIGKTKLVDSATIISSGGMEDPQTTSVKTNYQNDPGSTSTTTSSRLDPSTGKYQIQASPNQKIDTIISNTIRDSEYIAELLKAIKENPGSVIDENGYIDYFRIRYEIEQLKDINPETQQPKQIYKYIVTLRKMHISAITILSKIWDPAKYPPFAVRTYNYMYTGKNTDVIGFKINFNSFYQNAVPEAINNDIVESKYGKGPTNSTDITFNSSVKPNDVAQLQFGVPASKPVVTEYVPADGPGAPRSENAYRNLARYVHGQFLNHNEEGAQRATLDIIGDPMYLTTNGFNGYWAGSDGKGFTSNGEADIMSSQVPISLNFRNPVDIGKSGFMDFSQEQIPFSGIYQLLTIDSYFNEGIFKQRLNLNRIPGQLEGKPIKVKDYSDLLEESANPLDQITTDTTDGVPNIAGKVSDATIKRLGGTVLSNLGKAAALVGAASLLKNVSGQAATVLAASLAVPAVIGVAKSAIDTVNGLASKATGLIGNVNEKVASAPNVSASTDPTNNITEAAKQGIPVDLIDKEKLTNIPKAAPPAKAPGPQVDVATLQSLYKSGGVAAIAKAYGVKDITNISPTELPLGTVKMIEETITPSNPLTTLKGLVANASSAVDASIVTDKLASAQTLLNQAQSVVTIIPRDAGQATSILAQAGSNVTSPLTKILQG